MAKLGHFNISYETKIYKADHRSLFSKLLCLPMLSLLGIPLFSCYKCKSDNTIKKEVVRCFSLGTKETSVIIQLLTSTFYNISSQILFPSKKPQKEVDPWWNLKVPHRLDMDRDKSSEIDDPIKGLRGVNSFRREHPDRRIFFIRKTNSFSQLFQLQPIIHQPLVRSSSKSTLEVFSIPEIMNRPIFFIDYHIEIPKLNGQTRGTQPVILPKLDIFSPLPICHLKPSLAA